MGNLNGKRHSSAMIFPVNPESGKSIQKSLPFTAEGKRFLFFRLEGHSPRFHSEKIMGLGAAVFAEGRGFPPFH